MSSSPSGPARWEKLGRVSQLATRIFEVLHVRYRHPARGTERDFVVVDAPDWVNVLAVTPDDHLVLVRQFRYGIDEFSLEIPGGVMDPVEYPVTAVLRELREGKFPEFRQGHVRLLDSRGLTKFAGFDGEYIKS